MKILLVNDTSGNPNWGCKATCEILKKMAADQGHEITGSISTRQLSKRQVSAPPKIMSVVDETFGEKFLRAKIPQSILKKLPLCTDVIPSAFEDYEKWAKTAETYPIKLFENSGDSELNVLNVDKALRKSDAVLINGEGSTHGNRRIFHGIMFIAYLAKRMYNIPVIIANHSLTCNDPEVEKTARAVYPLFDDIIFREPLSIKDNMHILPRIDENNLAPDAAFLWRPIERKSLVSVYGSLSRSDNSYPEGLDFTKPYICVALGSGFEKEYKKVSLDEKIKLVSHFIKKVSVPGYQLLLLCHGELEEKLFSQITNLHGVSLLPLETPIQDVVNILGNASLVIGGRWHSAIIGLTGGTPFISLSANTTKMHGLNIMLENNEPVYDIGNLEAQIEGIKNSVLRTLAAEQRIRGKNLQIIKAFRKQVSRHIQWFT